MARKRKYVIRHRGSKKICVSKKTGRKVKMSNCKHKARKRKARKSFRDLSALSMLSDFGRRPRRRRTHRRRH